MFFSCAVSIFLYVSISPKIAGASFSDPSSWSSAKNLARTDSSGAGLTLGHQHAPHWHTRAGIGHIKAGTWTFFFFHDTVPFQVATHLGSDRDCCELGRSRIRTWDYWIAHLFSYSMRQYVSISMEIYQQDIWARSNSRSCGEKLN